MLYRATLSLILGTAAYAATFGRVVPLVGGASDLVLDEPRGRLYLTAPTTNLLQIYSLQKQTFQTLATDQTPLAAALSRNGKFLYVACYNGLSIDVIDLDALTISSRVSLPARPEAVAVGADNRVLISTIGTNGSNILLLYDPVANVLTQLAVTPTAPGVATFPPPSGRPFLSKRSQLVATRSGSFIAGVNTPAAGNSTVYIYESASATVLLSRTLPGISTVVAISDDGTRIQAGSILFERSTLRVLGQQDVSNVPYPMPLTTSFTLTANQGGAIFAPDSQSLYVGLNVAPVQGPTSASQLMIDDPDNLLVKLGLIIPENLAGRIVISADGSNAYALSDSGFVVLPLSTVSRSPVAAPSPSVALLTNDPCGVTSSTNTATIAINNAGTGRLTPSAQLLQIPGQAAPPSPVTAPAARSNASGIAFSYNTAAARGLGTIITPHDFLIQAPEAINIPDRVRVYENSRDSEARGTIIPISVNSATTAQLTDLLFDATRQRVYIANSGLNRIEVYDIAQQKLLAPIKVGQLPSSIAMTPDGSTLYVANSNAETITVVDPDKLQAIGNVSFPPVAFGSTLAIVRPLAIAVGLSGPQVIMSNNTIWKVAGDTAVPRPASTILGPIVSAGSAMASTPGGEFIVLLTNAVVYLYDATLDDFVAAHQLPAVTGYQGPITAGPQGQYFIVNGTVLNQSLVPQASTPGLVSAVAQAGAQRFAIFSPPAAAAANTLPATAPLVSLVDANAGIIAAQVNALEGPITQIAATGRAAIAPRSMAVDTANSVAYAITTSGLSIIPLTAIPAANRPSIRARGVVSLATSTTPVSANGLISIFGSNLASDATAGSTPLPTTLGGSCVTLNNIALPLFMTSAGEVHAQIPPNFAIGNFPLVVRSLGNHAASPSQTVAVARYAPAPLVNSDGQLLLLHSDGTFVNSDNPANRDEPLVMYAVGLGPTTGAPVTAGNPSPSGPLAQTGTVEVFFGNPLFTQAGIIVDWSGLAPGMIGVYQLNLRVPGFHIKGDALPVTIKVGGVSSSTTTSPPPQVWVN